MQVIMLRVLIFLFGFILYSIPGMAADSAHALPAETMNLLWAVPFVGILGSLAVFPLMAPSIWHHHYGKISLFWALSTLIPMTIAHGFDTALYSVLHTYLLEYIPFILVAMVLFTISGGIKIQLSYAGTPLVNTSFLFAASLIASLIGTTGAAMLFIRPLLAINHERKNKVHIVLFFILLVCNVGGCLTALGDPPLFLGFLKGVPFFWPFTNLLMPLIIVGLPTLLIFFITDTIYYKREDGHLYQPRFEKMTIEGVFNFFLLFLVMVAVIISGSWKPGISFHIYDVELELQNLLRDLTFIGLTVLSMMTTKHHIRTHNLFSWEPILEVAKLFASIFITAMPVIAILGAGENGALKDLVSLVTTDGHPNNTMYFWLTGFLSSFLDNAPTYLVFFFMAGGDAALLSGELSPTLTAISAGAVFMGALTYIGNAPNFLVKSIAEMNEIRMPSFFVYSGLACVILIPSFILLSYLVFRG
jgi:Na+/H+ antiporter NhaD/arsenite permease-like protein